MASSGSDDEFTTATEQLDARVQNAEFFRSLVEGGSDAIISINEQSTIIYANESANRVFGYDPDELIGEKLTKIMPDRFRAEHFDALDQYLQTGDRQLDWNDIELPAQHKDGHEVPLSITFEEHSYEGERVFSGIMRDISDRVERERELERQNEQLEQFASVVSHDLRDPLMVARSLVAVAKAGDDDALDELEDVFDRMDQLIEDVLTLAKQGKSVGELSRVDPTTVAEEAWSTVEAPAATLESEPIEPFDADPERLRTLFENLFRNAIEHGGSDVTVTVSLLDDGPGFAVADDGPGFGETTPEKLFEFGYTTNDQGTGFGLGIVEEIATAHGWTVTATESEQGGARFEIER